jgi:hydrogenase expression/formation protein HypE
MRDTFITLDHGSGGEASHELVHDVFMSRLSNRFLDRMDDSAVLNLSGTNVAMTTDSYVVDPIFFPGGDIGSLAVHGTVNDLSMQGAVPLYLTLGMILEEGFPLEDLARIVDSIALACRDAGVFVVAGDTKVVPKGHADKIFINTAGIGSIPNGIDVSSCNGKPGDLILVNGTIGDHGLAIMTCREGLELKSALVSDSAALNSMAERILHVCPQTHILRDPTRGGVATALNEIAVQSGVGIDLLEDALPISKSAAAVSEILGIDPLYVANEGKCLVFVAEKDAKMVLRAMKDHPFGKRSTIIGEVTDQNVGKVLLKTRIGGTRILPVLTGEQLPRIC